MELREPVVFKSEDSLWQMLRQGTKSWDARHYDMSDPRMHRLAQGHWEQDPPPGRRPYYQSDETFVCFLNKLTGETLQFRFRGLITPGWAPGWCFIQLGGLVATYDAKGEPIHR